MKRFRLRGKARWRLLKKRLLDLPSIVIAFSGIALWCLWPSGMRNISNIPKLQAATVSFVALNTDKQQLLKSPTIFALPSIYGFGATDDVSGMPDVTDKWYNSTPHYLARDVTNNNDSEIIKLISINTKSQKDIFADHRMGLSTIPIFKDNEATNRELSVVFYGDLRKYKLEIPELGLKSFDDDKSWVMRLFVQIDEKGYPEQIFIEKGSNIPEFDAKIIRMINKGRLKWPGIRCEGRIIVNFGL